MNQQMQIFFLPQECIRTRNTLEPFYDEYLSLQTISFCELFELDVEELSVKFDRVKTDSIVLGEKSFVVKKSHHLVLSKNSKSLGEV